MPPRARDILPPNGDTLAPPPPQLVQLRPDSPQTTGVLLLPTAISQSEPIGYWPKPIKVTPGPQEIAPYYWSANGGGPASHPRSLKANHILF
jgi:hypothetical protein